MCRKSVKIVVPNIRRRIHDHPVLTYTSSKMHSPHKCGDRVVLKFFRRSCRDGNLRVDFIWWNDRLAARPKDVKRRQTIKQVDISLQQDDVLILDQIPASSINHILCKSMDHRYLLRVHGDLDHRAPNVYSCPCGSTAHFPFLGTHLI